MLGMVVKFLLARHRRVALDIDLQARCIFIDSIRILMHMEVLLHLLVEVTITLTMDAYVNLAIYVPNAVLVLLVPVEKVQDA